MATKSRRRKPQSRRGAPMARARARRETRRRGRSDARRPRTAKERRREEAGELARQGSRQRIVKAERRRAQKIARADLHEPITRSKARRRGYDRPGRNVDEVAGRGPHRSRTAKARRSAGRGGTPVGVGKKDLGALAVGRPSEPMATRRPRYLSKREAKR